MDVILKDEFHFQTAGTLIALRIIIAAMMKTHPDPETLLSAIQETLQASGSPDGGLLAPIQAAFDERLQEMTSHLYARTKK